MVHAIAESAGLGLDEEDCTLFLLCIRIAGSLKHIRHANLESPDGNFKFHLPDKLSWRKPTFGSCMARMCCWRCICAHLGDAHEEDIADALHCTDGPHLARAQAGRQRHKGPPGPNHRQGDRRNRRPCSPQHLVHTAELVARHKCLHHTITK